MRKIWNIVFVAFAAAAFTVACTKASELDVTKEEVPQGEQKEGHQAKPMTITATIPADIATKVTFTPDVASGKPNEMALTWTGDESLNVYDAANHSKMAQFTFVDRVGDNSATFQCDDASALEGAESYDVEIIDGITVTDYNAQTQADDGDTGHLKYVAGKNGITDLKNINFDVASSILAITVQMSATGVAQTIKSVEIIASAEIFNGKNTLTIKFPDGYEGTPNTSSDKILNLYATLPVGATIAEGVSLIVRLNSSNPDHTVYTRYIELASGSFAAGKLNTININATQSDTHAGKTSCDGSSAENAYLIGDKYQLLAVEGLMKAGETKYFKLIDNVDMEGAFFANLLNKNSPYNMLIDFDGNNKTISNLGGTMFYVFKGSVKDLTLEGSTVTGGSKKGVFAQFIQGTGNVLDNVDIKNITTFAASNGNCGGLIGLINSGSSGITTATIKNCDIVNVVVNAGTGSATAGGVIGKVEAKIEVENCSYSGNTVKGNGKGIGGFVGYVNDNLGCVFKNCRVEDATVDASGVSGEAYAGGFVGYLGASNEVKGCKVGTSSTNVQVKTGSYDATNNKSLDSGGFVGINYGKITINETVRSEAYVKVTSANTTGNPLHLGGFVGYNNGTTEYCDATVDMTELSGQHIGGFAGYIVGKSGVNVVVDHCTVSGSVSGDDQVGGFVGVIDMESGDGAEVTNCSASSSVNATSLVGGFAGEILAAKTLTENESTGDVTATSTYVGGFAGRIAGSVSCSGCGYREGKVWSNLGGGSACYLGGFAGYIGRTNESFTGTISRCIVSGATIDGIKYKEDGKTTDSSGGWVGGFAGGIGHSTYSNNEDGNISLCRVHNTPVSGGNYCGGFAGVSYSPIEKCGVSGKKLVQCYGNSNGGFIGYQQGHHVQYCYSNNDVRHANKSNVGGLIGNAKNTTVEECYSVGSLTNSSTSSDKSSTWGGMLGIINNTVTYTKLIRWNDNNATSIVGNQGSVPDDDYVKQSGDSSFQTKASSLDWSTTIWNYSGTTPSLVGLPD